MSDDFDLFGNPVPDWREKRGRPPYQATERDRNKIKMLLALGWSIQRMANAIDVSPATLKRYFRAELKQRDAMRDRLDARRFEIAMDQANAGNVAALRVLSNLIDRNDLSLFGHSSPSGKARAEKQPKLGKKEAAIKAAHEPDTGTTLGELMARRQGQMN